MANYSDVNCNALGLTSGEVSRFWQQVEQDDDHLLWQGPRLADGTPQANLRRRPRIRLRAAHVAWDLLGGEVRTGLLIRSCDSPQCIAPEHHRIGKRADLPCFSPERRRAAYWAQVDQSAGPDACWPWLGSTPERYGRPSYGRTMIAGEQMGAHRAAWLLTHGPIPEGKYVCHRCDFPPCCNPAHLFLGDPSDNSADMVAKGRSFAARGLESPHARLTSDQVRGIRAMYHAGFSARAAAESFGVDTMTAWKAAVGETYPDVPMPSVQRPRRPYRPRRTENSSARVLVKPSTTGLASPS